MDYEELENLWDMNTLSALEKFYGEVNSPGKAIEFSLKRKKADVSIHYKNNGNKMCFVIPTSSFNEFTKGNYWKFISKFDTIIVESNGKFFNYAHSMNTGIREALNYGYSKIVLSNDDMMPIDSVNDLNSYAERKSEPEFILPAKVKLSPTNNFTISDTFNLVKRNSLYNFFNAINWRLLHKKNAKYMIKITKKFVNLDYAVVEGFNRRVLNSLLVPMLDVRLKNVPLFNSFGIFDAEILQKEQFDTSFINGKEDYDFIIRILRDKYSFSKSTFRIGDIGGLSLSKYNSGLRPIKDLLGDLILNHKLQGYLLKN